MLTRSHKDRISVSAREATNRSKSVAELGMTRYMDLINTYRAIARSNACGDSSLVNTGTCTDGVNPSWHNAGIIPHINSTTFLSAPGLSSSCAAPPPGPSPSPGSLPADLVSSFANQQWRNIHQGGTTGQFRLINYTYDPSPTNIGTLTVEGRVRQDGGTETIGTGTARLAVTFPIEPSVPKGLWINHNPDAITDANPTNGTPESYIHSAIQDSTCPSDNNAARVGQLKWGQQEAEEEAPPVNYDIDLAYDNTAPGLPFPALPGRGDPANPPTVGICTRPQGTITGMGISETIPDVGCTAVNGVYTYRLNPPPSYHSIHLNGGSTLTVDAPGETVELYLDGGLVLHNNSSVEVTQGTKLIVYVHGAVDVFQESSIINNNTDTDFVQIYKYNTNPTGNVVNFLGLGVPGGYANNVFIFAPDTQVALGGMSNITGTIWSRSIKLLGDSWFQQGDEINLDNLEVNLNMYRQIGDIISWSYCERKNPANPPACGRQP